VTILHPENTAIAPNPAARYHTITNYIGFWIILITGEYAVEGRLVHVARPDLTSECPSPVVTIDTGYGSLTGPVLDGDIIAAPIH
jgi:hypothetical protein